MAACEFLWDQTQGLGVGHHLRQVDRLLPDRAGHGVADRRLGDEPEPNELAPDRGVVRLLLGEADAQLIGGDQPLLDQQLSQAKFLALLGQNPTGSLSDG